jgi:hypothetical protein
MSAFLGVIVGGVLALIGSFAAKIWDEWRQAVSLRGAFRAEIAGLLAIAEARKHEAFIEESIAAWKSGNDIPVNFFGLEHAGRVPVFTANVGAIGTIGRQLAVRWQYTRDLLLKAAGRDGAFALAQVCAQSESRRLDLGHQNGPPVHPQQAVSRAAMLGAGTAALGRPVREDRWPVGPRSIKFYRNFKVKIGSW